MKTNQNIIIVGAGLSGVCLAYQLTQKGNSVTIYDKGENWSSKIAAGLITPLVFRRMTKSWLVDEVIAFLKPFYKELEETTNTKMLYQLPIRRMFSTEQERGFWLEKQEREDFEDYMAQVNSEDDIYDKAINNFGSGRIKSAFYVKVESFFSGMEQWLSENCSFKKEAFDYDELTNETYKGKQYDSIIFCEGFNVKDNPYFNTVPIDPTKGQTLTAKIEGLPEDVSLNRKCFMLPLGDSKYKIGSTYEWHNDTTNVTEEGKNEILNNLTHLIDKQVNVLSQGAGVRPTVKDRRPIIGQHHTNKRMYIFNGLGAKGYMLAPYLGNMFCEYLLNNVPLDSEVDISRIYNKNNP